MQQSEIRVIKFGGSTVEKVPSIATSIHGKKVLVVSAVKGMTDALINGHTFEAIHIFHSWMKRHSIPNTDHLQLVKDALFRMEKGSPLYISYGEKLTAIALVGLMKQDGQEAVALFADSFLYAAGSNSYDCTLVENSAEKIAKLRVIAEKGITPIVTGFCAQHVDTGKTVLLGRDGSDYTASFVAKHLNLDVVIVTDVAGLMTIDPRITKHARCIPCMSRNEARELAFHGANILHRKTLDALHGSSISLWVVDIFGRGTIIKEQQEALNRPIALAILEDRVALSVTAESTPGFCAKVFESLSNKGISVEMVLQTCSETEVTVIIQKSFSDTAEKQLTKFGRTTLSEPLGIITLVGDGMNKRIGLLARVCRSISTKDINIRCISQGPSERSLSIAVDNKDARAAAISIHHEIL